MLIYLPCNATVNWCTPWKTTALSARRFFEDLNYYNVVCKKICNPKGFFKNHLLLLCIQNRLLLLSFAWWIALSTIFELQRSKNVPSKRGNILLSCHVLHFFNFFLIVAYLMFQIKEIKIKCVNNTKIRQ